MTRTAHRAVSRSTVSRSTVLVGLAFAGLFLLYLATATFDQQQNVDALSTLVPAWQLASHGNVYADQYAGFTPWFVQHGEHVVSNRLPGAILWATPFYLLLGRGGEFASVYPAAVASAAAATLAALFVYLAVRRLAGRRVGLVAAFAFALATPTWSVSADALWTHGTAQMALALSLVFAADDRLVAMGLAQAAAILTRPHLAVVAACMGIGAAIKARSLRPLIVVGLTSSLGLVALAIYYRLVYGTWTLSGGYGSLGGYGETPGLSSVSERVNGTSPFLRNVAEALVSPGRGLFVYSPFLLLLLPGLRAAWSTAPVWVRSAAVGGLVYAVVQLWGNGYSGEDFFGYRFLLEPLTLWTPLLTLAYLGWVAARPRVATGVLAPAGRLVRVAGRGRDEHGGEHPRRTGRLALDGLRPRVGRQAGGRRDVAGRQLRRRAVGTSPVGGAQRRTLRRHGS